MDKKGNYNQSEEETFLTHCKYNFAVACPKCNMSYKKGVVKSDVRPYREKNCIGESCDSPCSDYMNLQAKYCNNNHIILQPLGHIKDGIELGISYNLFQHFYEPNVEPDTKAFLLVEDHIERFKLNSERISLSIIETCEEIVSLYDKGIRDFTLIIDIIEDRTYLNVVGELFAHKIKDTFLESELDIDDIISFFKLLVILSEVY